MKRLISCVMLSLVLFIVTTGVISPTLSGNNQGPGVVTLGDPFPIDG